MTRSALARHHRRDIACGTATQSAQLGGLRRRHQRRRRWVVTLRWQRNWSSGVRESWHNEACTTLCVPRLMQQGVPASWC